MPLAERIIILALFGKTRPSRQYTKKLAILCLKCKLPNTDILFMEVFYISNITLTDHVTMYMNSVCVNFVYCVALR